MAGGRRPCLAGSSSCGGDGLGVSVSEAAEEVLLREGLAAWGRGDVDALERLLDPDVTLRAMRPGPWDCDGREQVMDLMRLRAGQKRRDPAAEVTVQRMDQSTFLGAG